MTFKTSLQATPKAPDHPLSCHERGGGAEVTPVAHNDPCCAPVSRPPMHHGALSSTTRTPARACLVHDIHLLSNASYPPCARVGQHPLRDQVTLCRVRTRCTHANTRHTHVNTRCIAVCRRCVDVHRRIAGRCTDAHTSHAPTHPLHMTRTDAFTSRAGLVNACATQCSHTPPPRQPLGRL